MVHTANKARKGLSRQMRTDLTGYAFILPNVLGFALFTLVPMVVSLVISFTDWDYTKGFGNWTFNMGANYVEMWRDSWFTNSLLHTVYFSIVVVPVTIALALVIAVVVDRYCYAKLPIRLAMFMPYISNVVAVAIVWVMMYSPWGPFTQMVQWFGVAKPPQWLGNHTWALPAIMLMTVWSGLGYAMMIYTSSITALPKDVYEAAEIDGSSEITKFFKITVPFLSPTTFFLVITTFITSFQVFAPIQIMTRGGPGNTSHVLVYYIYTTAFSFYRMGYAASLSWILFLILFGITLVQWTGQKKWVSY